MSVQGEDYQEEKRFPPRKTLYEMIAGSRAVLIHNLKGHEVGPWKLDNEIYDEFIRWKEDGLEIKYGKAKNK